MNKKEIVNFVEERTFGDIIGAPFYFIIQEFKLFAGTLLKYAGPFVALSLLSVSLLANDIYSSAVSNVSLPSSSSLYGLILFLSFALGALAVITVTNSYITLYVNKGKGNFTKDDVGDMLKQNVFKVFAVGLITSILTFLGILLLYLPGIYLSISFSFVIIILVYEKTTVGKSISRSFEVIKGYWWQTFGLVLVFGMIIGAMAYVFIIPPYVIFIYSEITGTKISENSAIFITLFVFLYFTAYLFLMSMQQIMIAFQYFSILSKKEGLHLKNKIAAIFSDTDNETKAEEREKDITEKEERETEEKDKEQNRFTEDDDYNRFKPKQ